MPQTQEDRDVQEVVRAHAGWVFACAKRRVRDDALAEDVAQAAFILLWQKGASLDVGGGVKVTGWLYRAVRYCAGNALRLKQIRQRHEREAAMAALADGSAGEVEWSQVSPELEWAVDRLRDEDRSAVLLRFYRQMSFSEVGQALGVSEEAAKKRVQRAVEKLRRVLAKKGVVAGTAALGVVMAEKVTAAAPAGLVEGAAAAGCGGTGSAGVIAKGAMKTMAWAKIKVAAMVVIGVAGAASLAPLLAQQGPATKAANGAYGPIIQRTLNPEGTGKQTMLDLDTGRIIDSPQTIKPFRDGGSVADFTKWAAGAGVDFVGDGGPWLVDAVVMSASPSLWEQPPKEPVLRLLREFKGGTMSEIVPDRNGEPICYLFRTREGAIGVLRIAGRGPLQSEPPAWRVEYRLLGGGE